MSAALGFRGRLAGVTYTDAALFEQVARDMGYPNSRDRKDWRPGIEVRLTVDGVEVRGQVWARTKVRGYVWVALENGRYVALNTRYGGVYADVVGRSTVKLIGRIAS